ncbi:MAG: hypothetical protein RMY16_00180 [Nostoc sp. DedQUE12b]|nr:hypothetical protein [Nostoc sp. DedQUE12b]MDZ8084006.1 hypothetical protein [Nostoc sp. DedQUE12b]
MALIPCPIGVFPTTVIRPNIFIPPTMPNGVANAVRVAAIAA